jgi:hypothetical protein
VTHAQWHARLRACLALVHPAPARAARSLQALLRRVQSDGRKNVSDWHIAQTLEAISIVQPHLGDHRRSAATILEVAAQQRQHAVYSTRAFVAACATAALELASAGDRAAAAGALREAAPIAADLRPKEKLFQQAVKVVASMRGKRGGRTTAVRRRNRLAG